MNEKLYPRFFDRAVKVYKKKGGKQKPVYEKTQFQVRHTLGEQHLRVVLHNAKGKPIFVGQALAMVLTKPGSRKWKNA